MELLGNLVSDIEHQDSLERYRIEVHALKSNAAMIGALLLSKLSRILEVAAVNQECEKIRMLNSVLLDEMQKHHERLAVFEEDRVENEERKEKGNAEQSVLKLMLLKQCLEDDDYNMADSIVEELQQYCYIGETETLMKQLFGQISNLDTEEAQETAEKLITALRNSA